MSLRSRGHDPLILGSPTCAPTSRRQSEARFGAVCWLWASCILGKKLASRGNQRADRAFFTEPKKASRV